MTMRCAYTGKEVQGPIDAVWDDGEWISWEYINTHLDDAKGFDPERDRYDYDEDGCYDINESEFYSTQEIFERLVFLAKHYHQKKDRYLDIWGELGELYGEVQYGIKRHREKAQGSDGRIMNDFIEIKTISPGKTIKEVRVKRAGHFNMLLVVKIDEHFNFESKMIDRKDLPKGTGKIATVKWEKGIS